MLTIYGIPLSVHTRKVIMTAIHKGIDHHVEVVLPIVPGQVPANWGDLSPTGLIPAITDGDYTLADSTAIVHYLETKHPGAPILPKDAKTLGRALWFDAFAGGTLFREVVRPLFQQVVGNPKIKNIPTDHGIVQQVLHEVAPKLFDTLESRIDGDHLAGPALGVADLAVASNLINFHYLGFTIDAARHPRLRLYLHGILRTPLFRTTLEREIPFADQMGLKRDFLS